jgi:hypothetical protein
LHTPFLTVLAPHPSPRARVVALRSFGRWAIVGRRSFSLPVKTLSRLSIFPFLAQRSPLTILSHEVSSNIRLRTQSSLSSFCRSSAALDLPQRRFSATCSFTGVSLCGKQTTSPRFPLQLGIAAPTAALGRVSSAPKDAMPRSSPERPP